MIIVLKTASPTAELQLLQPDGQVVASDSWEAGRSLSSQLLSHTSQLLRDQQQDWKVLQGVVVFRGPGSFTGLRIGVTVANAIAYAQEIPIVGTIGKDWLATGLQRLTNGETDAQVVPYYGSAPRITKPGQPA